MSATNPEDRRARLFIALDIPDAVRAAIGKWGAEALTDPALRPVSPQSLHLTLCFLGNRPEEEIGPIGSIVTEAAGSAPRIELSGPVPRPAPGRPRLFALEADSPGTVALQAALRDRLVLAGLFEPEGRPFWPHLTVARVRTERGRSKRPMRIGRSPRPLPGALKQAFGGVRVTLYRSKLQPLGAQYTPLAQVELSEDGRQ
jgi:2'-5' RNA ligase